MSSKTLNTRLLSRYDSYSNWMTKDPILMAGELAVVVIPQDAGSGVHEPSILLKVGDGTKKFSELGWLSGLAGDVYDWAKAENKPSYAVADIDGLEDALASAGTAAKYSTVESVDAMNQITSPNHGDVCIVKTKIGNSEKESYTAYVYDTNKWSAMDGNYSADNVYLKDDITLAGSYSSVGNIALSSGTFNVAGKSIADALKEIFTKRLQPTKTNPSISVTLNNTGAKEVGTIITPTYSTTFRAGSYTYGPATGVTVTSYTVNGKENSSASGTLDNFTVADNTRFQVSVTANYAEGAVAKDNLGDSSNPEVKISAGSVSGNSAAITGYRNYFYGILDSSTSTEPLTSDIIRGLTKANKAAASGASFTLSSHEGAKRIVVALPKNANRTVKEVLLTSAMNSDITATYVKQEAAVQVEGASGFTPIDYDVYIYEPASMGADEVHKITLG